MCLEDKLKLSSAIKEGDEDCKETVRKGNKILFFHLSVWMKILRMEKTRQMCIPVF
jgi:hypothetical protein